jgi:hypothetical protein
MLLLHNQRPAGARIAASARLTGTLAKTRVMIEFFHRINYLDRKSGRFSRQSPLPKTNADLISPMAGSVLFARSVIDDEKRACSFQVCRSSGDILQPAGMVSDAGLGAHRARIRLGHGALFLESRPIASQPRWQYRHRTFADCHSARTAGTSGDIVDRR